jgi:hypothetical protein
VFGLRLRAGDAKAFKAALRDRGIDIPPANGDGVFVMRVNETWARRSARDMTAAFLEAAGR